MVIKLSDILTIIATVLGSSALFTFIQFMITRKDNKDDKDNEVKATLVELKTQMVDGFSSVDGNIKQLREDMNTNDEALRDSLEATKATTARVRILRASDEILHKMRHSKEWFDQLNDDITYYKNYCETHPEFINNKARHAIDNIDRVYAKALKENDFL